MTRRDAQFESQGSTIAAHLYLPEGQSDGKRPAVVLCHGFAGVKELLLPAYAEKFAAAGYVALTFDYRGFGASEGEPGRLVPALQIEDIEAAVTFLAGQDEVDSDRIALWGTSLGGANAVVAASKDDRIKCVAVQLTFADGERVVTGDMSEADREKFLSTLARMADKREKSGKEMMVPLRKVLTDPQSAEFYERYAPAFEALKIKIPFLTVAETMKLKPELAVPKLAAPLLVIGAEGDGVNPPDESRKLFEAASDPKELLMIEDATHYELYEGALLDRVSDKQIQWFEAHL